MAAKRYVHGLRLTAGFKGPPLIFRKASHLLYCWCIRDTPPKADGTALVGLGLGTLMTDDLSAHRAPRCHNVRQEKSCTGAKPTLDWQSRNHGVTVSEFFTVLHKCTAD